MKILTTQYTLSMKSLDVYTAGCKAPHCVGCFNPETWDFDQGDEWGQKVFDSIKNKVKDFSALIERIMIFGGEPLDNPLEEVISFLTALNTLGLPIWLFTRRTIEEVPEEVKELCSYIKCGRYEQDKKVEGYIQYDIELSTSNQKIYKMEKEDETRIRFRRSGSVS